jgi:hypothetical protein
MSYRDRRLREAAQERDSNDSDTSTDEETFDRRLFEAAEEADSDDDDGGGRDVRPGRGTEDRVVEREPSPEPTPSPSPSTDPSPEPTPSPEPSPPLRAPRSGAQTTPSTEPDQEMAEMNQEAMDTVRDVTDRVREETEAAGEAISEGIETLQEAGDDAVIPTDPTAQALGVQEGLRREASPFETGAVGGLEVFNVPQTALGLAAAGGFAGARLGEVARGEEDVAAQRTARGAIAAGEALEEQVTERPVETVGAAATSVALSGGGFLAAARLGGRAGLAARAAVQPGEELIGQVGGRGTRAIAGERAADTLFPNNEPILFSEEAAIRGVERFAGGVQDLRSRTSVAGVGAGVPAIEIETEQETEDMDDGGMMEPPESDIDEPIFREPEPMSGGVRRRGVERDPFDDPFDDPFESPFELEIETESELEQEIERETEAIRTQVGLNLESIQQDVFETPTERPPFEIQTPIERTPFETEFEQTQVEIEQEQETEQELEFRRETETRREVEPFDFFDMDDMGMVEPVDGMGFQAVDTEIRPLQEEPGEQSYHDDSELEEDLDRYRSGEF